MTSPMRALMLLAIGLPVAASAIELPRTASAQPRSGHDADLARLDAYLATGDSSASRRPPRDACSRSSIATTASRWTRSTA